MSEVLSALVGWILLAALVIAIGATVARWAILPRLRESESEDRAWMRRHVTRIASYGGFLLPLAMALLFGRQLSEFRDPFAPLTEDVSLLLSTAWGDVWMLGTAGSFLTAAALFMARRGSAAGWWTATVLLLALAAFPAFTGHAAGEEERHAWALIADVLHVLAASGWIGGLATVLYLERQWRKEERARPRSLLPTLVPVFSPVAVACVTVLVLTGVFASWLHLSSVTDLVATSYGRALGVKLLVVAAVMTLGALNWKRLTPRLGEVGGTDALRRAATTELLLGQLVLFITAILIRTSPM